MQSKKPVFYPLPIIPTLSLSHERVFGVFVVSPPFGGGWWGAKEGRSQMLAWVLSLQPCFNRYGVYPLRIYCSERAVPRTSDVGILLRNVVTAFWPTFWPTRTMPRSRTRQAEFQRDLMLAQARSEQQKLRKKHKRKQNEERVAAGLHSLARAWGIRPPTQTVGAQSA